MCELRVAMLSSYMFVRWLPGLSGQNTPDAVIADWAPAQFAHWKHYYWEGSRKIPVTQLWGFCEASSVH